MSGAFEALVEADPTQEKVFCWWLCDKFISGQMKFEDRYKARAYLEAYVKLGDSQVISLEQSASDLQYYNNLPELFLEVKKFTPLTNNQIDSAVVDHLYSSGQIEVIYKTGTIEISIPHSAEAAIYLGRGTQWCVSASNNNMFDDYNKKGPLIMIRGAEISPVAIQFADYQFRDVNDEVISLADIIQQIPVLRKILPWYAKGPKDSAGISDYLAPEICDFLYARNPTREQIFAAAAVDINILDAMPHNIRSIYDVKLFWTNLQPDMPASMQNAALSALLEEGKT